MTHRNSIQRITTAALMFLGWLACPAVSRGVDIEKYAPDEIEAIIVVRWNTVVHSKPAMAMLGGKTPFQYVKDVIISQEPKAAEILNIPEVGKAIESLSGSTTAVTIVMARDGGLFLDGKFDSAQLLADVKTAASGKIESENVNGSDLITIDHGLSYAVTENGSLIVIGEDPFVRRTWEARRKSPRLGLLTQYSRPKLKKELIAHLQTLPQDRPILFVAIENHEKLAVAGQVQLGDSLELRVDVELESAETATRAEADITSKLSEMAAEFHRTPAAAVLKLAKITRDGKHLTIEGTVPADLVGPAVAALVNPPSDLDPIAMLSIGNDDAAGRGYYDSQARLAFSGDGKLLAVASSAPFSPNGPKPGALKIYDVATQKVLFEQELGQNAAGAASLSFHPTTRWLAPWERATLANPGNGVAVWDIDKHQKLKEFDAEAALFSPDGKYLACIGTTGVKLYHADTWEQARELPNADSIKRTWGGSVQVPVVGFSGDGARFVLVTQLGQVNVYTVATGELAGSFQSSDLKPENPTRSIDTAALSPDGALVAVGIGDTITLVDLATRTVKRKFNFGISYGATPVFSPDGTKLVISGWQVLKVEDLAGGDPLFLRPKPARFFGNGPVFSPRGHLFAAPASDKILLFDLKP